MASIRKNKKQEKKRNIRRTQLGLPPVSKPINFQIGQVYRTPEIEQGIKEKEARKAKLGISVATKKT